MTIEQDLKRTPFDELYHDYNENKSDEERKEYLASPYNFYARNRLKQQGAGLIYPRIMAFIASLKLNRNSSGKIDGLQFWKDNTDHDDIWMKGLYLFIREPKVSLSIASQNKEPGSHYCAFVPIIPAAFKRYNDIPYSDWDVDTIHHVCTSKLAETLQYKDYPEFSRDELLNVRQQLLQTSDGKPKKALSTYGTKITTNKEFDAIPELAKLMYVQIWCALPEIRNKYMILDPKSWDTIPEPLTTGDIFVKEEKPKHEKKENKIIDMSFEW